MCAAIEVLKVLNDEKMETEYPVGAINWTKYYAHDAFQKPVKLTSFAARREHVSPFPWYRLEYGLVRSP